MMIPIPKFSTHRLLLKGVCEADAKFITKYFADYEVIRHLADSVPWPYPEKGAENYIRDIVLPNQGKGKWTWGIFLKESPNEIIGCIDLWIDGKPENRGFWLARKHWNQGIMTEAMYPIIDFAFDDVGFEKLIVTNALGNIRSRKVKEKTACRLIDVTPCKFVDPKYTEQEVWELTREDWEQHKQTCNKSYVKEK
jgi:RimJ/RimL family protein N-acetyltransferase